MIKRLGALLVAAALVAGAFLARRAIDDDEPTVHSGTAPATAPADDPAVSIVCSAELGAVCASITAALPGADVQVEPAYATLDTVATSGEAPPVWVTISPFPGMIDAQRAATSEDPLGLASTPVGLTPLAVASTGDERLATMEASCAGEPLWRCIGDAAGSPWADIGGEATWGSVRPSLGDVDRSALALIAFGGAVAGYFDDPSFTKAMWEADPAFLPWLRKLAETVPAGSLSGGSPLATMASRPSALDLAATSDAEMAPLSADPGRFGVQYPQPAMSVEAVLAAPAGAAVDTGTLDAVRTALTDNGWEAPGASSPAAPSASTTLALRQLWRDAT